MSEEEKEQGTEAKEDAKDKASEGEESEAGSAAPPKKKKKIILLGLIVLAVLIAIPAGLHFSGIFPLFGGTNKEEAHKEGEDTQGEASGHGTPDGEHAEGEKAKPGIPNLPAPPVTFELDEFLVNLNTPGKQARFLKMTIALELPGEAEKEAIKPYVPRIRDAFQLYLRELREEDVKGSAALYRLREELMLRLSKVVYPIKVDDVLFKEILTQ